MLFIADLYLKSDSGLQELALAICRSLSFSTMRESDSEWYDGAESWVFEGGGMAARLFRNSGISQDEGFDEYPYCFTIRHSFASGVDTVSATEVLAHYYAEQLVSEVAEVVGFEIDEEKVLMCRNPVWKAGEYEIPRVVIKRQSDQ